MAFHVKQIPKSQRPDKTPYTFYYPLPEPGEKRLQVWIERETSSDVTATSGKASLWRDVAASRYSLCLQSPDTGEKSPFDQDFYQFVSIDPASKNYAIRIERRYHSGHIVTLAFDKVDVRGYTDESTMICQTYSNITALLDRYSSMYADCHFIVVEKQMPHNYRALRIAQHTLTYFLVRLGSCPIIPVVIELDPQLKGRQLGAARDLNQNQLKAWAVGKARDLFHLSHDLASLKVMDQYRTKQDDLADTKCMIEALCSLWGLPLTSEPPPLITLKITRPVQAKPRLKIVR